MRCLAPNRRQPSVSLSWGCVKFSTQPLTYCLEISCVAKPPATSETSEISSFQQNKPMTLFYHHWPADGAVWGSHLLKVKPGRSGDWCVVGDSGDSLMPFLCNCCFFFVHIKVTSCSLRSLFWRSAFSQSRHSIAPKLINKLHLLCLKLIFFPQSKLFFDQPDPSWLIWTRV